MVRVSHLLLNGAAACVFSSSAFAFSPSFSYGSTKVRGVSLGGWLVLEVSTHATLSTLPVRADARLITQPWITPSIFDNTGNANIVDEWTFGELQDIDTALPVLQNHWNTWITEADFEAIAAAGYVPGLLLSPSFVLIASWKQVEPRTTTDRILGLGGRPGRALHSRTAPLSPKRGHLGQ
jgi:hypothetical protein